MPTDRVSHACQACAKARVKCEEIKPCSRCQTRNLICQPSPAALAAAANAAAKAAAVSASKHHIEHQASQPSQPLQSPLALQPQHAPQHAPSAPLAQTRAKPKVLPPHLQLPPLHLPPRQHPMQLPSQPTTAQVLETNVDDAQPHQRSVLFNSLHTDFGQGPTQSPGGNMDVAGDLAAAQFTTSLVSFLPNLTLQFQTDYPSFYQAIPHQQGQPGDVGQSVLSFDTPAYGQLSSPIVLSPGHSSAGNLHAAMELEAFDMSTATGVASDDSIAPWMGHYEPFGDALAYAPGGPVEQAISTGFRMFEQQQQQQQQAATQPDMELPSGICTLYNDQQLAEPFMAEIAAGFGDPLFGLEAQRNVDALTRLRRHLYAAVWKPASVHAGWCGDPTCVNNSSDSAHDAGTGAGGNGGDCGSGSGCGGSGGRVGQYQYHHRVASAGPQWVLPPFITRSALIANKNRVVAERLEPSGRQKILELMLNSPAQTTHAHAISVASALPSTDVLDGLIQVFLAFHRRQEVQWISLGRHFQLNAQPPEWLASAAAAGSSLAFSPELRRFGWALQKAAATTFGTICSTQSTAATVQDIGLVQAMVLNQDIGLWSGNCSVQKIARGQMNMPIAIMRSSNRLHPSAYVAMTLRHTDNASEVDRKWSQWEKRESWKRLAFHCYLRDVQVSITEQMAPSISYEKLPLPLPESRELWLAQSAPQWQSRYYYSTPETGRDDTARRRTGLPTLGDLLRDISLFTEFQHLLDVPFAISIYLHGFWSLVWDLWQLRRTHRPGGSELRSSCVVPGASSTGSGSSGASFNTAGGSEVHSLPTGYASMSPYAPSLAFSVQPMQAHFSVPSPHQPSQHQQQQQQQQQLPALLAQQGHGQRDRTGLISSLLRSRQHELSRQLLQLQIEVGRWHDFSVHDLVMLHLLQMHLYVSLDDIQAFAGRDNGEVGGRLGTDGVGGGGGHGTGDYRGEKADGEGCDDGGGGGDGMQSGSGSGSGNVDGAVLCWSKSAEGRQAIWHAGQILARAKQQRPSPGRQSALFAVAIYQAALILWTWGVVRTAGPAAADAFADATPAAAHDTMNGAMNDVVVLLDSSCPSAALQQFIQLGRGQPAIRAAAPPGCAAPSSSMLLLPGSPAAAGDGAVVGLGQPAACMRAVQQLMQTQLGIVDGSSRSRSGGGGSGTPSAGPRPDTTKAGAASGHTSGRAPPIVKSLYQRIGHLGDAASAVGLG